MKRLHGSFFSASVLLAAALFMLNGCDNFMSGDKDFKAKIKQEVTVANAAKVDIRVIANAGSTTTTPSGVTTVKVGVPFNLYLTKVDDNYGFVRWAAFYRNDLNTELADAVEFGNPLALETTATLKIESADLQIMPVCEKRPSVLSKLPESSVQSAVVRNFPVKVYFSKVIDPSSFIISTSTDGTQVKRDSVTGLFKNISIQGTESALDANGEFESYEKYFYDPELSASGKILTIQPRSGADAIPPMKKIAVTLDKAIFDSSGLSMAQDYNWTYYVGASEDNEAPFFNAINAGSQAAVFFDSADEASHRIGSAGTVYLSVDAADAIASVSRLYVTETLTHLADGTIPESSQTVEKYFDYIDDDNDGSTAPVFAYQLQTTTDGVVSLALQVSDSNGNRTALADAPVYRVIRDTVAPDAAANSALLKPEGQLNNYYNGVANNQIRLPGSNQITDSGFAGSDSVLRTRSANVEWSFSFNSSTGFDEWSSASGTMSLAIPAAVADGSIPLYVKFRDDLGNASEAAAVNGLLLDRTPPVPSGTGPVSIQGTTEIGEYRMLGSPEFKAILQASDSLSGIWKYLVAEGSAAPSYADPRWTAYSDGVTASCTVSNTDGSHALNAWFMDKAGNITASPSSDSAFLDNTDPTVSSFFLRAASAPSQSGTAMANPGSQYSNSDEWYFGFIASDGQGSGVGSFSYSIGSATSDYFSAGSGEILSEAQTSGALSVSMVKRTDLGNGLYFVSGKLKIDAVNDSRSITLRVRDRVRLSSSSAGVTNGNRIVFDNRPPVVGSVAITAPVAGSGYYSDSSGTLWSASNAVTLSFSATEARTAGEAVSGLKSYAIANDAGSSALSESIAESISAAAENLYAASPAKALSLSGTDGLKKLMISAADHAGNSGGKSFSVVLDATPPDATVVLKNGSITIASNSIAGVSGNGTDASGFTLDLSASDPAPGDGSAGAGVKAGAAHEFSLYYRTNSGAENLVAGSEKTVALGSSSAAVTLPVNGTLGRPSSGTYIAQVAVFDNVENKKAARAGYYFDRTPPSFSAAPAVFNVSGAASLVYQAGDGTLFVNTPQVIFRTAATDRPSVDPEGSGISSGRILWTRTDSSGTVTSGSTESAAASEPAAADPALRYLWSGSGVNGSSSSAVAAKPFTLANGSKYQIKTAFADAAGNEGDSGTAASFTVSLDQTSPVFSALTAGLGTEVVHHSKRYGKTPSMQFTPSDGLNGSGVRAWKVDSSNAVYTLASSVLDDALTGDNWNLYGSGAVNGTAKFSSILSQNTAVKGYIHLMDFAGNHSTRDLDSAGTNSFVLDTTSPTVSAVVERTDGTGFPGAANFTTTRTVRIKLSITETGVGLKTLTLAGPYTVTAVTPPSGAQVSSISADGKTITFTSTDNLPAGTAFTVELAATL
ncbi:MAG: hypothetical protein JXP39_10150, partial [Spirochaetales bacterium]|nr:hypothetical protein [Spirochaetales bacterium]